ncbi:hypothetical protein [Massilia rubra]|uniref:Uncharacterized protein n=1 Tax=Massilia rubra TaxID=2607910 RepID=A0ABX0LTP7_9BURK|nr:hypothetical protein [Massilia rubra]NHZ35671.1 hypothetical protein [Massilia rubra]
MHESDMAGCAMAALIVHMLKFVKLQNEHMNQNPYAPPQADMTQPAPATGSDEVFYIVSQRKFTILFLATVGMYEFYWFYRQWGFVRQQRRLANGPGGNLWPAARAVFALLFVQSLFSAVAAHAAARGRPLVWNHKNHGVVLVTLIGATHVMNWMPDTNLDSGLVTAIIFILVFATCYSECLAQGYINQSCGDPRGEGNKELTRANYIWIALGCVLWVVLLVDMFMLEEFMALLMPEEVD